MRYFDRLSTGCLRYFNFGKGVAKNIKGMAQTSRLCQHEKLMSYLKAQHLLMLFNRNFQQSLLACIIYCTAIHILLRLINKSGFYRILMDILQFFFKYILVE